MRAHCSTVIALFSLLFVSAQVFSQASVPPSGTAPPQVSYNEKDSGHVGIAIKASTLGGGAEVAVRVTDRTNLRGGFNVITYSRGFNEDGIPYDGQLNFRTFEAHYDVFPWARSFHISGGILVYAADPITATAHVPANQSFSLGDATYFSDPADPVRGSGKVVFHRAAPTLTFGFGNLVPRGSNRHFSIPVEFGVAFQGSPKTTLGLSGSVCDAPAASCRSVPSDPAVQAQIVSEQNKINSDLSFFKVYPIVSVGFGYKF